MQQNGVSIVSKLGEVGHFGGQLALRRNGITWQELGPDDLRSLDPALAQARLGPSPTIHS